MRGPHPAVDASAEKTETEQPHRQSFSRRRRVNSPRYAITHFFPFLPFCSRQPTNRPHFLSLENAPRRGPVPGAVTAFPGSPPAKLLRHTFCHPRPPTHPGPHRPPRPSASPSTYLQPPCKLPRNRQPHHQPTSSVSGHGRASRVMSSETTRSGYNPGSSACEPSSRSGYLPGPHAPSAKQTS